ncbi:zinc finger protein 271-like [Boleophthalmus pectinirostris]|uniref:zinc finger protein 271-like n=1 Tax=Boleophthalmus pectinirostris TaxID=150288 RepID=UPI00242A64BB|nr:zinc finger protein 271-like [Boleophthalmus pectinirostris]
MFTKEVTSYSRHEKFPVSVVNSKLKLSFIKMFKQGQRLRALVNERLSAAAEEIFVLFERTIAEYEEELRNSKEENQRKQGALDSVLSPRVLLPKATLHTPSPDPGLMNERTGSPQVKEEAEEQNVKQEKEQFPECVPESSGLYTKPEEFSLLQQTDHREETQGEPHLHSESDGDTEHSRDTDEDWSATFSYSAAQMDTEDDGDHFNKVQIRARNTSEQNSGPSPKYNSAPETSTTMNYGTAKGVEERKHQCSVCKKRFKTKQSFQRHLRIHTGERPYSCSVCKNVFTQSSTYHAHMRIHTGEKPFSCSFCKKTFARNTSLVAHRRIHTGERPYSCPFCERAFFTSSDRDKHQRIHTGEKPYSCSTCNKTFALKGTLQGHIKTHTAERPYRCSVCKQEYADESALKKHIQTHLAERPYSCSVCKKEFTQSSTYQTHMRIHTGEKPFSCSVCMKTFARNTSLVIHRRTHTGERPYSCPLCEKAFLTSSDLDRHKRIHTGEKPYSCLICDKPFTTKDALKSHMKTHTGVTLQLCSLLHMLEFGLLTPLAKKFSGHCGSTTANLKTALKMSKQGQRLRALVNERLSAAAEEIFALFERTIAEYEEELRRSKEENQRKQSKSPDSGLSPSVLQLRASLHTPSPGPGLKHESLWIPQVKEECIKQEEEQQPVLVPESSVAYMEREQSSLLVQTEQREEIQGEDITSELHLYSETEGDTEHSTDTGEDWRAAFSHSAAQMDTEADGDHCNQVQIRSGSTTPQNSDPSPKYNSAPETSTTMNYGTAEGVEEKKHQCSVCKKRFREKHQLNRHHRIHTGEKPFSCTICKKTFSQNTSLIAHRRTHTGERPYNCPFCEKAFLSSSDRDKHQRIHTGEKPYSCSTCDKTFALKGNLNAHMKTHREERPYSCSVCKKVYTYASALKRHLKKHAAVQCVRQGLNDALMPVHL